jgi:hypothetical protein
MTPEQELAKALEACRDAAFKAKDFNVAMQIEGLSVEAQAVDDSPESNENYRWLWSDKEACKRIGVEHKDRT